MQREKQTEWFSDLIFQNKENMKVNILGKSFKPETNIVTGSPALLLKNILEEKGIEVTMWDPLVDQMDISKAKEKYEWDKVPQLYFIGTMHKIFKKFEFCNGSVVIDPWRIIENSTNIRLISLGVGPKPYKTIKKN